jgi:hypothetical protein
MHVRLRRLCVARQRQCSPGMTFGEAAAVTSWSEAFDTWGRGSDLIRRRSEGTFRKPSRV